MRRRLAIAVVLLPLVVPVATGAQSIGTKIDRKEAAIEQQRSKERVLVSDIEGFSAKIDTLEGDIGHLQAREDTIQSELDVKLARLTEIQDDLRAERARLVRLRAELVESRRQLSARLVELYKADNPDLLNVVMESDGFADLLENSEFVSRVGQQDNKILVRVRVAKAESVEAENRLSGLETEQKEVTEVVEQRRDEVAAVKNDLVDRRDSLAAVRSDKRGSLSSIRGHRHELEGDLSKLREEEARISGTLAQGGSGSIVGQVQMGSGGISWPANGPIVSPFGQRWGRLHAGVDIAVPSGTPILASAPGTVAIAGWVSGYGNYVCVQHSGGLSTCNGHNTSLTVSVGQHVERGQVLASSGCTGHCYGPHTHFETRVNGTPVDPMGYL